MYGNSWAHRRTWRRVVAGAVALVLSAWAVAPPAAFASYTAIVGKGLTADGSVLFFHQEDLDQDTLQHLRVVPRQHHDLGETPTTRLYWIEIPQVETTWGYLGLFTYDPDAVPGGLSAGINEWGVTIAMNVGYPREPRPARGTGLLWSDFMQVVLERARSAREGVAIVGELVEKYHLTDDPGQMYGIADPNEGWIIETTPIRWVARRVADNGYEVRANAYRIGSRWDMGSADIVEFARQQGWYDPSKGSFDFARVYTAPERYNLPYNFLREQRSEWFLERAKPGGISVEEIMQLMRDHYEHTFLYHDPPDASPYRNIELDRTVASIVAQLRPGMPPAIGALAWISPSPPATTPYLPFYAGITDVPQAYRTGRADRGFADFTPDSAWWSFNILRRRAQQDWNRYVPILAGAWKAFEAKTFLQQPRVEAQALAAYRRGDTETMVQILTDFVAATAGEAHQEALKLRGWIGDPEP